MSSAITIDVELDGRMVPMTLPPRAVEQIVTASQVARYSAPATEPVIEGYKQLSDALRAVGVKRHPKTLERWTQAGKLPVTRFGGRPRFTLSAVMQRIQRGKA